MVDSSVPQQLPLFEGLPPAPRPSLAPLATPGRETALAVAAGAFDQHLDRLGKTDNTRRAFASDLRILAQWFGAQRPVGDLDTDHLQQYLTWLREVRHPPSSAKTYARRVTSLKVFCGWLAQIGALAGDPALTLVHLPAEAPLPLVLTDDQVAALLAGAEGARPQDPRPALLVRLLLDTGLKKGELVKLALTDLALSVEPPTLLVRYADTRWRLKERRVSFGPAVAPLLAAYVARYQPAERLFACTARNLEYVLADLVAAAELPAGTCFETLRWTSALRHWRAGTAPEALRERLGLSPITWAETGRKLALLADGVGPARVAPYFPAADEVDAIGGDP